MENDSKKITDWMNNYKKMVEKIYPSTTETPFFTKEQLCSSANDTLFISLINLSIAESSKKYTQTELFQKGKSFMSTSGKLSNNIKNFKADYEFSHSQSAFPDLFHLFLTTINAFPNESSHPVKIPENLWFFFHTLFFIWKKPIYIPSNPVLQENTDNILAYYTKFQKCLDNLSLITTKTEKNLYLSRDFNDQLFQFFFNIKAEQKKDEIKNDFFNTFSEYKQIPAFMWTYPLDQFQHLILSLQKKQIYPTLQVAFITSLQNQINEINFSVKNLGKSNNLTNIKKIPFSKYLNGKILNSINEIIKKHESRFKKEANLLESECFVSYSYSNMKIKCLKDNISMDEYRQILGKRYETIFESIKNDINRCIIMIPDLYSQKILQDSVNQIFPKINQKFKDAEQEHLHRIEYNQAPLSTENDRKISRRSPEGIERNADCCYPIREFNTYFTRKTEKWIKKLSKTEVQSRESSSLDQYFQQLQSIFNDSVEQISKLIDLQNQLASELVFPNFGTEDTYQYLKECGYFCQTK